MTAFNVVRMKVKPGQEDAYLEIHRNRALSHYPGMVAFHVVKTGDREYVIIGQWTGMDALAAARDTMVATLDDFRDKLEELEGGVGVTDPRSGEAVVAKTA